MSSSSSSSDSSSDFATSLFPSVAGPTSNKQGKGKAKTVEERYQKKTPIEHILHRPESYIGSVQLDSQTVWIWSEEDQRFVYKQINFVPGLFKIFGKQQKGIPAKLETFSFNFCCKTENLLKACKPNSLILCCIVIADEILVNAADVKARETQEKRGNVVQTMTCIKVDIDRENQTISVRHELERSCLSRMPKMRLSEWKSKHFILFILVSSFSLLARSTMTETEYPLRFTRSTAFTFLS